MNNILAIAPGYISLTLIATTGIIALLLESNKTRNSAYLFRLFIAPLTLLITFVYAYIISTQHIYFVLSIAIIASVILDLCTRIIHAQKIENNIRTIDNDNKIDIININTAKKHIHITFHTNVNYQSKNSMISKLLETYNQYEIHTIGLKKDVHHIDY